MAMGYATTSGKRVPGGKKGEAVRTSSVDEEARRHYWTEQMEQANRFLEEVSRYPVLECGEPLVSLVDAVREAGVEVVFSSKAHATGESRLFMLRSGLIGDFVAAARELDERGWVLKVEDAFRTASIQRALGRAAYTFDVVLQRTIWELNGRMPTSDIVFRRLSALVAPSAKLGTHMSGSAIDVSILQRGTGQEVDRGGSYLELSERTPMEFPFVSIEARENRRAITQVMNKCGFAAYPWEFWHYNRGDAYWHLLQGTHQPAQYGPVDADLSSGAVTETADANARLNSEGDIEAAMAAASNRLRQQGIDGQR
jgi:D-alanyl-D-alanine dipeptidase